MSNKVSDDMIDQYYNSGMKKRKKQNEAPSQIRTCADRFEGKD